MKHEGKAHPARVLFLIRDLGMGGAEKVLVNLVNNMDRERFQITVMALFDYGVNRKFLLPHVQYRFVFRRQFPASSHFLKLFTPHFLYRHVVKEPYDIVVSYLEGPCARIVSGCGDNRVKTVSWIHVEHRSLKALAYAFRNVDECRMCHGRFDRTVCVSSTVRDNFMEILDFQKPAAVLYNVNETEKIKQLAAEEPDFEAFTAYTGLKLCALGKLKPSKGMLRLATIHQRLLKEGINHRFYILGEGPQRAEIEDFIRTNKLQNSFHLLGYQENPYRYVARCDLMVSASIAEGFSTAVSESLILGTPVAAALCSGMEELLGKSGEHGIVTPNDDEALYQAVKRLLSEPGLLDEYKRRAVLRGRDFSTEKTVAITESFLLGLLEESDAI